MALIRMERVVSFRLSEEEYQQLLDFCRISNARSVSAAARSAMNRGLAHAERPEKDLGQKLEEIERRMASLTALSKLRSV